MPLQIINSVATWILKKRIHQMELFLKYPHEVQEELLLNLVKSSENTQIGRKYDFSSMKSYTTFSERIPVSAYEAIS